MNKKALVLFGPEMFSAKVLQMKKGGLQQKKVPKSEEKKTILHQDMTETASGGVLQK